MRRRMRKPSGLKLRRYVARLIDLNEYLALFPGDALSEKIGVTELNIIMMKGMPNIWSKQVDV